MTGQVVQFLHEIPDLALEAVMTIDHPHRGSATEGHKPTKAASYPAPTNLHALVALWVPTDADIDRGDPTGSLLLELLTAVRVVVEEFADDKPQWADPLPDWPDHTWTAVCAWLRLCAPLWSSDAFTEDWVGSAVRRAYTGLRALTRAPKEVRYICPECGDQMRLQAGDQWFQCDSGHQIEATYDPAIRREPAAPTSEICARFNVTPNDLANWRRRGKLTPHKPGGAGSHEQAMWFPWDVFLIQRPDIAQAVAAREAKAG